MTFRHDCEQCGCYLKKHTPDWGFLKNAFPRGIEPTDLDGWVEINSHFLTLEWKGDAAELTSGQEMAFKRRTKTKSDTVFVLYGDSEKTEVTKMRVIFNERIGHLIKANNKTVYERCQSWAAWADRE